MWDLTELVIGACIEVHRHLGPGLLESAYEECLCHELRLAGLGFARQRPLAVRYKGIELDCGYRLDIVVQEQLILELKAVDRLLPVHEAQLLTYLKLTDLDVGLLISRWVCSSTSTSLCFGRGCDVSPDAASTAVGNP